MADRYLPGFKSGGPIRSLSNLVARLGGEVAFRVVTRDRDGGDTAPYPGIAPGWQPVGRAEVRYLAPAEQTPSAIARTIKDAGHEVLYLNSLFSPRFTLVPLALRRLGMIPRTPVVLAPRGELSSGALSLKSAKKRTWLQGARMAGLYRGIVWHATAPEEAEEIRGWFGADARVFVAANLGASAESTHLAPRVAKVPGRLRVLFLSRIARKKNLDVAIRALALVRGVEVEFHVHGPREDAAYWEECRALADMLPANVRMEYRGEVEHARVAETMRAHDLFFLPTRGENYGHAIAEALRAGTPALLADTTPWRGLEAAGAGWDLPADDVAGFARAVEAAGAMDAQQHARLSAGAIAFAATRTDDDAAVDAYRAMFRAPSAR